MRVDAAVGEWVPLDQHLRIPKCPGVYAIRDAQGREYIGKSSDVRLRLGNHRGSKGNTTSRIGRAIAKHGPGAFECCLLVRGAPAALSAMETLLIAQRGSRAPAGYNLTDGGDGTPGHRLTDEHKARISAANTGREKTVEGRKRIGDAGRGRKPTEATRQKISDAGRGRKMSEANRAKLVAAVLRPEVLARRAASLRGQVRTAEARAKMSASARRRGTAHIQAVGQANRKPVLGWPPETIDLVVFASATEAAKTLGTTPTSISEYCKGQVRHSGGWAFAYL